MRKSSEYFVGSALFGFLSIIWHSFLVAVTHLMRWSSISNLSEEWAHRWSNPLVALDAALVPLPLVLGLVGLLYLVLDAFDQVNSGSVGRISRAYKRRLDSALAWSTNGDSGVRSTGRTADGKREEAAGR